MSDEVKWVKIPGACGVPGCTCVSIPDVRDAVQHDDKPMPPGRIIPQEEKGGQGKGGFPKLPYTQCRRCGGVFSYGVDGTKFNGDPPAWCWSCQRDNTQEQILSELQDISHKLSRRS